LGGSPIEPRDAHTRAEVTQAQGAAGLWRGAPAGGSPIRLALGARPWLGRAGGFSGVGWALVGPAAV